MEVGNYMVQLPRRVPSNISLPVIPMFLHTTCYQTAFDLQFFQCIKKAKKKIFLQSRSLSKNCTTISNRTTYFAQHVRQEEEQLKLLNWLIFLLLQSISIIPVLYLEFEHLVLLCSSLFNVLAFIHKLSITEEAHCKYRTYY